jgi:DEAD/DEAH box helicase domain-containing protein
MDPPTQIPNLLLPDLAQNGKTEPNILIFWNICTSAIRLLRPTGVEPVTLIEAIADDRANNPLLPLRVHKFMRAVSGLWSCLNPSCTGERPTEWPFGALAFERAERCGHCHAPLFEISDCRDCGEPYLGAFDRGGLLAPAATAPDLDEFAAASEREDETSLGEDEEGSASVASAMTPGRLRLIATRAIPRMTEIAVYPATGALPDRRDAGAHISITSLSWDGSCPACHAAQRVGEEGPIRPFRFGAPFLIAAAPVFLDSVRPMDQSEGLLPGEGRRLLSFTDSRQGTALRGQYRDQFRARLCARLSLSSRPEIGHDRDRRSQSGARVRRAASRGHACATSR